MFFIIKFLCYFTLSFLILSTPIADKNIFYYLQKTTSSYTTPIYNNISQKIGRVLKSGSTYTQKAFQAVPEIKKDQVSSQYSSPLKESPLPTHQELEKYTNEEKSALIKVLKKAH